MKCLGQTTPLLQSENLISNDDKEWSVWDPQLQSMYANNGTRIISSCSGNSDFIVIIFADDWKVTEKGLTSEQEVREHQAQFRLIN